jgi:hypothetical protein
MSTLCIVLVPYWWLSKTDPSTLGTKHETINGGLLVRLYNEQCKHYVEVHVAENEHHAYLGIWQGGALIQIGRPRYAYPLINHIKTSIG